jgi:hypothetical protein
MSVRKLIHEVRTGWHQGVINRAEERAARSEAILTTMGEKPHRPGDCSMCRRHAVIRPATTGSDQ